MNLAQTIDPGTGRIDPERVIGRLAIVFLPEAPMAAQCTRVHKLADDPGPLPAVPLVERTDLTKSERLLQLLQLAKKPQNAHALAQAARFKVGSVCALLNRLVDLGLAERVPGKPYAYWPKGKPR